MTIREAAVKVLVLGSRDRGDEVAQVNEAVSIIRGIDVAPPDPIQFSAARTGWVSYANNDKDGTPDQMRNTFRRFLGGSPKHGSPVEHQATPFGADNNRYTPEQFRSNLRGWIQARKLVAGERIDVYAPPADEVASWGLN